MPVDLDAGSIAGQTTRGWKSGMHQGPWFDLP